MLNFHILIINLLFLTGQILIFSFFKLIIIALIIGEFLVKEVYNIGADYVQEFPGM